MAGNLARDLFQVSGISSSPAILFNLCHAVAEKKCVPRRPHLPPRRAAWQIPQMGFVLIGFQSVDDIGHVSDDSKRIAKNGAATSQVGIGSVPGVILKWCRTTLQRQRHFGESLRDVGLIILHLSGCFALAMRPSATDLFALVLDTDFLHWRRLHSVITIPECLFLGACQEVPNKRHIRFLTSSAA